MEEEQNSVNDTLQIEKIVNLVNLFRKIQTQEPVKENNDDELVNNKPQKDNFEQDNNSLSAIRVIKAAIPYLDYTYQRNLSFIIKLMEIDKLLKKYSALTVDGQSIKPENKKNMLMAIRPELELRQKKILDMFLKIIEIKEITEDLTNGRY